MVSATMWSSFAGQLAELTTKYLENETIHRKRCAVRSTQRRQGEPHGTSLLLFLLLFVIYWIGSVCLSLNKIHWTFVNVAHFDSRSSLLSFSFALCVHFISDRRAHSLFVSMHLKTKTRFECIHKWINSVSKVCVCVTTARPIESHKFSPSTTQKLSLEGFISAISPFERYAGIY